MMTSVAYLALAMARHPQGGPYVWISGVIVALAVFRFLGIGRRGMF
jgi:hypothetical protein